MTRKTFPWLLFLAFTAVLVFSSSGFVRLADSLFWPIRVGLLAGLSSLLVWAKWRHRGRPDGPSRKGDAVDRFLASALRWHHGDSKG